MWGGAKFTDMVAKVSAVSWNTKFYLKLFPAFVFALFVLLDACITRCKGT